jgi:hypothetical protein
VGLELVINIVPALRGIIVDKEAGIPAAIELAGAPVKAFGRLVKQHVARCEYNFVCAALKVL